MLGGEGVRPSSFFVCNPHLRNGHHRLPFTKLKSCKWFLMPALSSWPTDPSPPTAESAAVLVLPMP